MDASTIIWRVQPEEHTRALRALNWYHVAFKRRLRHALAVISVLALEVMAVVVIAARWMLTRRAPLLELIGLGIPAVALALYAATRPLALNRAIRKQLRFISGPQERRYTFDAAGLRVAADSRVYEYPWRDVEMVFETPEFFLFFTPKTAYYLPKRAISWPDRVETVREMLGERLGERARVR